MSAKYFREIQISTKILGKHLNCWPFGPQDGCPVATPDRSLVRMDCGCLFGMPYGSLVGADDGSLAGTVDRWFLGS